MIKVTIWNENTGQDHPEIVKANPGGVHMTLAAFLRKEQDFEVRTATLADEECGLTDDVIADTDVLIWWGHNANDKVPDAVADKVVNAVNRGMGFIALHSSHLAKPFIKLMGTTCTLKWRDGDFERLWTIAPYHPIAEGVPEYIDLDKEEMYGERFDIPEPDELVFLGWFSGGEVFRSGCVWNRGYGKVFYFQPGHETNMSYLNSDIQRVIINAVRYTAPRLRRETIGCPHAKISLNKH
jgi:trehalose utilization protein